MPFSSAGKEEGGFHFFLLVSILSKETEAPSSLNQTKRTFESSHHVELKEAVKSDLLSLQVLPYHHLVT